MRSTKGSCAICGGTEMVEDIDNAGATYRGCARCRVKSKAAIDAMMCPASVGAAEEFTAGRVMWTADGWPIDARKPATLGECVVLGCANRVAPGSTSGRTRLPREATRSAP